MPILKNGREIIENIISLNKENTIKSIEKGKNMKNDSNDMIFIFPVNAREKRRKEYNRQWHIENRGKDKYKNRHKKSSVKYYLKNKDKINERRRMRYRERKNKQI